MRTLAILPVKSFDQAKQRLGAGLPEGPRRAMAEAMFSDVLTGLRRTPSLDGILVVTADITAQRIAAGHGAEVVEDAAEAGQSPATGLGVRWAMERGYGRVVLVPGDTPALDPAELVELLAHPVPDGRSLLVVPDRHGSGTNALVLTPPDAISPAFGPDSRARHEARAREAGVACEVVPVATLALDVDTAEDLAALRARFGSTRGGAAHTRGLLMQLTRAAVVA